MKIIILDKQETITEKEKIIKTLFWFDPVSKEMLHFEGGKLDLVNMIFDKKRQRKVPTIIDIFGYQIKNNQNREMVRKWIQQYYNYNNTDIEIIQEIDDGIELDVPDKEVESVLYNLERNSFQVMIT